MSDFTPGPWVVTPHPVPGVDVFGVGEIMGDKEFQYGLSHTICYQNAEANARLIAAAPDSHTANVLFVESMNQFCGVTPDWDDDRIYDELPSSQLAQAYFAARAAIAKAGGAA